MEDFSSIENTDWLQTWSGDDQAAAQSAVASARNGAAGRFHGSRTQSGLPKWWDVIVMPIRGADGRTERLLAVARDITERKQAEEAIRDLNSELRDKAVQLEAANKELESFSYSVSHDLRAPLRAIDGFSRIVLEDFSAPLAAEGRAYLQMVRDSTRQMGQLVDDLLAFARLGRQALPQWRGKIRHCGEVKPALGINRVIKLRAAIAGFAGGGHPRAQFLGGVAQQIGRRSGMRSGQGAAYRRRFAGMFIGSRHGYLGGSRERKIARFRARRGAKNSAYRHRKLRRGKLIIARRLTVRRRSAPPFRSECTRV